METFDGPARWSHLSPPSIHQHPTKADLEALTKHIGVLVTELKISGGRKVLVHLLETEPFAAALDAAPFPFFPCAICLVTRSLALSHLNMR